MVLNPAGFQIVFDYGSPRVLTGYAREAISGGQLVFISGASAAVSSGANSFASSDIKFAAGASGLNFTGVAMATVASGAVLPVCIGGAVISTSAGTILSSNCVGANGADAIVTRLSGSAAGTIVGRALSTAGSEGYCLWEVGRC